MKKMGQTLARLLSVGLVLALLTGLVPGALAAGTTLSYRVDSDKVLEIQDDDLYSYCKSMTGYGMNTIWFTALPDTRQGMLTYTDQNNRQYSIGVRSAISYSSLYSLTFTPNRDFDGTLTIPFEGQADNGVYYNGTLQIQVYGVNQSTVSGTMNYTTPANQALRLSKADFDKYVYDKTSQGHTVNYIRFTKLPAASTGVLYENYGTWYQKTVEENKDYTAAQIDTLSFVPAAGYQGTVTIPVTGWGDSGERIAVNLMVTVGSSTQITGDVTYDTAYNSTVMLNWRDFEAYAQRVMGDSLNRVWFTSLPTAEKGVFYYDFNGWTGIAVTNNAMYGYSELNRITFVPAVNYQGVVTVPFAGTTVKGKTLSGQLVIRVGYTASYNTITVSLQTGAGGALDFQAEDFNAACKEETGSDLEYVTFNYTSGVGGYLYARYDQTGQSVVGSEPYYRTATPSLDLITFVPGTATGSTVTIPFTGRTMAGGLFRGNVEIQFIALKEPTEIVYISYGTAAHFSAVDFVNACAARGGQNLVSVRFLTPDMPGGQLYYGFRGPAMYQSKVNSAIEYGLSGSTQLNEVSFLPEAGYTGTVTFPYVGTDAAGIIYTGVVKVQVDTVTSSRFNDMTNYSWAIPSVEFLADYGITTGAGTGATFSPAGKMTRGDYVLMLCRAFGFTSTQTTSFPDVPADSYYATALAAAKAKGIITPDSNGYFRPTDPVTREDSMVFLYRALKAADRTVPSADQSVLDRFPDKSAVSQSALPAVSAMVKAGVIQGNGAGQLNPGGTLTRAEMAVILHRGLTL